MTLTYDQIWAEAAANLLGYLELLETGEAQFHEAPPSSLRCLLLGSIFMEKEK